MAVIHAARGYYYGFWEIVLMYPTLLL